MTRSVAVEGEQTRTVAVQLQVATCEHVAPDCRNCRKPLDLLQPVIGQPESMLGICPRCGAWHYLTDDPGGSGLLVVFLPLAAVIGEAIGRAAAPSAALPDRATKRASAARLRRA
jgi:hypothetical protein